jgi:uncharacterized protein (DUF488 family)
MNQILTIGHLNHQWHEFAGILKCNQRVTIVNVKRFPGFKSFPQFNKENMAKELLTKNIEYMHIEKLGGRRNETAKATVAYDNSGWQNKSFRSYEDYMAT